MYKKGDCSTQIALWDLSALGNPLLLHLYLQISHRMWKYVLVLRSKGYNFQLDYKAATFIFCP